MSKQTVKKSLQELLTLARKLSETPGLTWVEANNTIYGPGGPFVRLFPTKAERAAFAKAPERARIDELIDGLPDPPVSPLLAVFRGRTNKKSDPSRGVEGSLDSMG